MSPEHSIIRTYLDTVVALPWNTLTADEIDIKKCRKKFLMKITMG